MRRQIPARSVLIIYYYLFAANSTFLIFIFFIIICVSLLPREFFTRHQIIDLRLCSFIYTIFCFVIFLLHRSLRYLAYDAIEAEMHYNSFRFLFTNVMVKNVLSHRMLLLVDIELLVKAWSFDAIMCCIGYYCLEGGNIVVWIRKRISRCDAWVNWNDRSQRNQTNTWWICEWVRNEFIYWFGVFSYFNESSNDWKSGTGCCVIFTIVDSFLFLVETETYICSYCRQNDS